MKSNRLKYIFSIFLFVIATLVYSQDPKLVKLQTTLEGAKTEFAKCEAVLDLGNYHYTLGNYSEALKYYGEGYELSKKLKNEIKISAASTGLGIVNEALGDYDKAIKFLFEGLKVGEKDKNNLNVAASYMDIALIYMDMHNYDEAFRNGTKALEISQRLKNKMYEGYCYNTIALIYFYQDNYSESLKNHNNALKIRQELGSKKELCDSYVNIGILYSTMAENSDNKDSSAKYYALTDKYYRRSLPILKEDNNIQGIAATYLNMSVLYTHLKNYKRAKVCVDSSYVLYQQIGAREGLKECYNALTGIDTLTNNYKFAFWHYKLYVASKDSLINLEHTRKVTQAQMQFDFNKKTETDSIQNAEHIVQQNIKHDAEIRQQRIYTYGGIIGFLFMLAIAIMAVRAFRNKQKVNLIITEQKKIVEQQKAEVEKQKDIIEEQKQLVEEHQKDVIDSITYAKRIQEAILPPEKYIKGYLPDCFILYKPKDIVAGDFYWFEHINGSSYIASADCTGHGVPGAMVSVVCSNALNRAVLEFKLTDPGKILDKTRELVVETFSKSDEDVMDGMDISLVKITPIVDKKLPQGKLVIPKGQSLSDVVDSKKKFAIEWAGANNPLWYFKAGEQIEITPHKQPIGKTEKPTAFPTHTFELNKGDLLFLLTDGYADQFGGPKGKKFKYKHLLEIISKGLDQPLESQKQNLNTAFENWKGSLEQIDDVSVIGIRV